MDRRLFLKTMAATLASPTFLSTNADANTGIETGRQLNLARPQSGEKLSIIYKRNGRVDLAAYRRVCALMRDVKADKMLSIDERLLDILDGIRAALVQVGINNPTFMVHSAFRTWQTNREVGGALQSYHMRGQAIDFHVPNVPTDILFKWMKQVKFHEGVGMGYYAGTPNWMHLDSRRTGHMTIWEG
jgi:uncharacterized protein YcbK (DUF882 family)